MLTELLNKALVGAHMPTSGGMQNALIKGSEIGCTAVQLFTKSPRQWSAKPLEDETCEKFFDAVKSTGIECLVAHDAYVINIASPDQSLFERSVEATEDELKRCERLGIAHLVMHPGAHTDASEDEGLAKVVQAIDMIHEKLPDLKTKIALETTAGQGTSLGWRFEHLARIIEGVEGNDRLSVCFDTCHSFAAGYDLRGTGGMGKTLDEFDEIIGLERLAVIHCNDSKKGMGSRVDRHEHLGKGEIGDDAFAALMSDSRIAAVPKIVETPESDKMHRHNVAHLKGMLMPA